MKTRINESKDCLRGLRRHCWRACAHWRRRRCRCHELLFIVSRFTRATCRLICFQMSSRDVFVSLSGTYESAPALFARIGELFRVFIDLMRFETRGLSEARTTRWTLLLLQILIINEWQQWQQWRFGSLITW
jgi:hypothetical protein